MNTRGLGSIHFRRTTKIEKFLETARCVLYVSNIETFFFLKIHTRPELYFPNEEHTVVRTLPLAKIIGRIIISICGLNKLVLEEIKKGKRR